MTFEEKLKRAALIASRYASINQTNSIRVEAYQHIQDEEFPDGGLVFEVSAYVASQTINGKGKTIEQALDKFLAKYRHILVDSIRLKEINLESEKRGLENDRQLIAELEEINGQQ